MKSGTHALTNESKNDAQKASVSVRIKEPLPPR